MPVAIAALGDRNPAYVTHREIDATIALAPEIRWVGTDGADIEGYDGLWVLPGTPYRDEAAALAAIRFAREHGMPMLGTCGGFQHMALEYARNAAGIAGAAHAEIRAGRRDARGRRAGVQPRRPGARRAARGGHAVGRDLRRSAVRRLPLLRLRAGAGDGGAARGLVVGAHADDAGVEAFELPGHPFYLATLFQPQVGTAERGVLHPLVGALLAAAASRAPMLPR